jgi:hypothetical protein
MGYPGDFSVKRILSLGAGVQSSCLAFMSAHLDVPRVDAAIFADTQAEPQEVYEYLEYITKIVPFPVYKVTAGDLEADFLERLKNPQHRCGQPPFYVWNERKQMEATLWRQCTKEYKLQPIRKKIKELAGSENVEQFIGISLDEAHRMKSSGVKYINNIYPLVDLKMTRHDCLQWLKRNKYPEPPKSACRFCPYINDARLKDMRDNKPAEWTKLVAFDHAMRDAQKQTINGARITGTLFVHRSCKPIDQVDLSTEEDNGQISLFGNECEGMCGV